MIKMHRHILLVPAVAALLAPGLGRGAGPTLGGYQKIPEWGYALRIIEDWNAIPAQPDERFVVGKWKPDLTKTMKRGDWSGQMSELTVVRVPLQAGTTEASGPEAEPKEEEDPNRKIKVTLGRNAEKRLNPKSMADYIEGCWEGASKRYVAKSIRAGKLKGDLFEFTSGSEALCIGVFRVDEIEWGIVYACFEEEYRKIWADLYRKSIASLKLFEPEGKPDAITSTTDMRKLSGEAKRKAIKASIAGSPGWYAIDTDNYVLLSNSPNQGFIKSLARDIEVLRAKVYEKIFPARKPIDTISIVRVLDTEAEYYQYGGPRGSAGYWNSSKEELVLFTEFEGVTKKNSKAYCKSVMNHEAFHQYIHYAVGDLAPHSWFNEGHGDYFAGMVVSGNSVRVQPFEWRVDYLKQHLRDKNDLIPLRSLVRLPQSEYYSNAGLKYAQGWALIFFLRNVSRNKQYREIPDTYFNFLADNIAAFKAKKKEEGEDDPLGGEIPGIPGIKIVNFEDAEKVEQILSEAVDKAFEGVELEALDKEFQAWIRGL